MKHLEKYWLVKQAGALRRVLNVRPAGFKPWQIITDEIRRNMKILRKGRWGAEEPGFIKAKSDVLKGERLTSQELNSVRSELQRLVSEVKRQRADFKPGQHWEMFLGNKPSPIGRLSMHGNEASPPGIGYGRDSVSTAWVDPKFRGMGLGKKLYGDVLRKIPGNQLESPLTSGHATKIWEGFGKRNPKYHANQTLHHPGEGDIIVRRKFDGSIVADDAAHNPMLRQQIGPPPDRYYLKHPDIPETISDPAVLAGRSPANAAAERLRASLAPRIDPNDPNIRFGEHFGVKLNLPKHMQVPANRFSHLYPKKPLGGHHNTAAKLKPKAASIKKNISREQLREIIAEIAEAKKMYMPRRGRPVASEPTHIKYGPNVHYGEGGKSGPHVARKGRDGTEHLYKDRVFIGDSRGGYGRKLDPEELEMIKGLVGG